MLVNHPVSDLVTRIRNGYLVKREWDIGVSSNIHTFLL